MQDLHSLNKVIGLAVYLVGLLLTLILFFYAQRLEPIFFPIVDSFSITRAFVQDDNLYIGGLLDKLRPCLVTDVNVWERDVQTGVMSLLAVDFRPDEYHGNFDTLHTRPEGLQEWGPWKLDLPASGDDHIMVISKHQCHPLWETETVLLDVPFDSLNVGLPQIDRPEL